ncbi:sporulation protein [Croceicoccus estronivorus]|uniref:SPOR domain-containing protein n=1 Tax=Croceicoccus estronivorus TaxID=1172626 RepID=UPI000835287E|nr:SPOR domain-containing protein [Croceicoccus estronivorus]OCC25287.1 sporulation protein [Croceicoccus estronivorus]
MRKISNIAVAVALVVAAPALADVKDGVDAWSAGDYAKAVAQWQEPAARGDADAQYNLAQAYRLGRGVPQNTAKAEDLYAKAAAGGHPLAADNYGLMLFQQGRRAEAIPYLRNAVDRGDPRAEYLLGVAHFNGDYVERDWVRAYALVTLAHGQGLPQAAFALSQMDKNIPLNQRQEAATLVTQMRERADATRAQQLASADLGQGESKAQVMPDPVPDAKGEARTPKPIASIPIDPSVAAAHAAVAEAVRVTGTESPADAGADFARPHAVGSTGPAPSPASVPQPVATTRSPANRPVTMPASTAAKGPWKVQLGAFSIADNAERLWRQLGGKGVLAGKDKLMVPAGRLTKLLAGGFATRNDADAACAALKSGGQACIVTR